MPHTVGNQQNIKIKARAEPKLVEIKKFIGGNNSADLRERLLQTKARRHLALKPNVKNKKQWFEHDPNSRRPGQHRTDNNRAAGEP